MFTEHPAAVAVAAVAAEVEEGETTMAEDQALVRLRRFSRRYRHRRRQAPRPAAPRGSG